AKIKEKSRARIALAEIVAYAILFSIVHNRVRVGEISHKNPDSDIAIIPRRNDARVGEAGLEGAGDWMCWHLDRQLLIGRVKSKTAPTVDEPNLVSVVSTHLFSHLPGPPCRHLPAAMNINREHFCCAVPGCVPHHVNG